jgi:transcriptional regulator NrdR family protein
VARDYLTAERRAREAGFAATATKEEQKPAVKKLKRELQEAAEKKKARQERANILWKKIEDKVKQTNPNAKFYWPEVD